MKTFKLILTILFVCYISGYSQFKEGYIITNSSDTLTGLINWEGSVVNSTQCIFKTDSGSESTIYKPGEIKAFRFRDSKLFTTWELPADNIPKTVFIEWLIQGRASILTYSGAFPEVKYFLLAADGNLTELTNSTTTFTQEGNSYERKKQEYINTLLFSFRDCPSLEPRIKGTGFNSKSFIGITKKYHELTCEPGEECVVFEDNSRAMEFSWGLYTGFLNSKWVLNSDLPENVYPSNTFGLGATININNLPVLPPKFSAKVDLAIYSIMYKYDTLDSWSLITDDRVCRITFAKMPVQISYKFTHSNFSPYIAAGVTANIRFLYKQYDQYLTDWVTRSRPGNSYEMGVSPIQLGINSGVGFEYISNPNLKFDLGYGFEFNYGMYGTYADDHAHIFNNMIFLRIFYGVKRD